MTKVSETGVAPPSTTSRRTSPGSSEVRKAVVRVLGRSADPVDSEEVTRQARKEAGLDSSSSIPVGEVIEGLVTGGIVRRANKDRRLLELTPEGRETFGAMTPS